MLSESIIYIPNVVRKLKKEFNCFIGCVVMELKALMLSPAASGKIKVGLDSSLLKPTLRYSFLVRNDRITLYELPVDTVCEYS